MRHNGALDEESRLLHGSPSSTVSSMAVLPTVDSYDVSLGEDDSGDLGEDTNEIGSTLKLVGPSPERWFMLFQYMLITFITGAVWIAFAPIAQFSESYYEVSDFAINLLGSIYLYFFFFIFLTFSLDSIFPNNALRAYLLLGAIFMAGGTLLRYAPGRNPGKKGFAGVMSGQSLCAVTNLFLLGAPAKLSQHWFPDGERTLATSILVGANNFGTGIGFLLSPEIGLEKMLLAEMIFGLLVLVLIFFCFKNRPTLPPSRSALSGDVLKVKSSIKKLLLVAGPVRKNFLLLCASFGGVSGVWWGASTVLDEVITSKNVTSNDIGWMGFYSTISGIIANGIFGVYVDRTHNYKRVLCWLSIGGLITTLAFVFFVLLDEKNSTGEYRELIMASWVAGGFFLNGLMPIAIELGCEITFPCHENIVGGVMILIANSLALALVILQSFISAHVWFYLILGLLFFAVTATFKIKATLSRSKLH